MTEIAKANEKIIQTLSSNYPDILFPIYQYRSSAISKQELRPHKDQKCPTKSRRCAHSVRLTSNHLQLSRLFEKPSYVLLVGFSFTVYPMVNVRLILFVDHLILSPNPCFSATHLHSLYWKSSKKSEHATNTGNSPCELLISRHHISPRPWDWCRG